MYKSLQFFDKDGYNLNFSWNETYNYWEGKIYLPKVSVGLYANTTIYIAYVNAIVNPNKPSKIECKWDSVNKFVDEFFMFRFDENYKSKETSSLTYTPNDGPECIPLIVNTFDRYYIKLDGYNNNQQLIDLHIAFRAEDNQDANTYNRTLILSHDKKEFARITFFAETVEEDERLKIWNSNLGYNITPEDTIIFDKSDIKECQPDYILLNEKRKELMMEGHNIYPFIGSYKAIINALKFFGYENLNIIEYWKCVNPNDVNFGKLYHSSKYSLTNKETIRIGNHNIVLPNKDYKKVNQIALVYSINEHIKDGDGLFKYDEYELPIMREKFTYTIEETMVKLFALRKKLNKEFMPGSSRIFDIIGEGNYFGLHGIKKTRLVSANITPSKTKINSISFDVFPSKYTHITDDRYFHDYVLNNLNSDSDSDSDSDLVPQNNKYTIIRKLNKITDIKDVKISDIANEQIINETITISLSHKDICDFYEKYYNEKYIQHTILDEYDDLYDDLQEPYAKVILRIPDYIDNIKNVTWKIKMSGSDNVDDELKNACQTDEELKNINIIKQYKYKKDEYTFSGPYDDYKSVLLKLKYIGYYDVSLHIETEDGEDVYLTKRKYIKVEPYNIDIRGFYYDARKLPDEINYDIKEDVEMYNFVTNKLNKMYNWAVAEKTYEENPDMSVPIYTAILPDNSDSSEDDDIYDGFVKLGPYYNNNLNIEWYLLDNVNYDIALLKPNAEYSRYIKNGVDVKPYTWILLGYDNSKICSIKNPKWTLCNTNSGEKVNYSGKYFTILLKEEGEYSIKLELEDVHGNSYEITRNIIVVNKNANYNIYQLFKNDYTQYIEERNIKELNSYLELPNVPFFESTSDSD